MNENMVFQEEVVTWSQWETEIYKNSLMLILDFASYFELISWKEKMFLFSQKKKGSFSYKP